MVCVFLSFMLGEGRVIQEFGLSLASAVFLDALVVRCLLLPAVLDLVGRSHLEDSRRGSTRILPRVNIEGTVAARAAAPGATGARPRAPALRRAHGPDGDRGSGGLSPLRGGGRSAAAAARSSAAPASGGLRAPPRWARPRPAARRPLPRAGSARRPRAVRRRPPPRSADSVVLAFLPGAAHRACRAAGAGGPQMRHSRPSSRACPACPSAIMSATQGAYTTEQFLLDITQGARVASSAYPTPRPPALSLQRDRLGRRRQRLERGSQTRRTTLHSCCARGCSPRGSPAAPPTRASPANGDVDGVARRPTAPGTSPQLSLGSRGHAARARRRPRPAPAARRGRPPGRRAGLRRPARAQRGAQRWRAAARGPAALDGHPADELLWAGAAGPRRRGRPRAELADHQRARADRLRGPRPHDPRPPRALADPGRHARRADTHRRCAALREPARAGSSPAGDRRQAPRGARVPARRVGAAAARMRAPARGRARGPCARARSACCGRPSRCSIAAALEPERSGGVRDDRARLPAARGAHGRAAAVAASPVGSGGGRGGGDRRGRPRPHPAADALAARPQPASSARASTASATS